jgi:hypothetical protein
VADHPVKVPPELFTEWLNEAMEKTSLNAKPGTVAAVMADRAAQWGADQELEACCEWLEARGFSRVDVDYLRSARRPEPPTLAEQGMEALSAVVDVLRLGFPGASVDGFHIQNLTAALNRLAELEAQQ